MGAWRWRRKARWWARDGVPSGSMSRQRRRGGDVARCRHPSCCSNDRWRDVIKHLLGACKGCSVTWRRLFYPASVAAHHHVLRAWRSRTLKKQRAGARNRVQQMAYMAATERGRRAGGILGRAKLGVNRRGSGGRHRQRVSSVNRTCEKRIMKAKRKSGRYIKRSAGGERRRVAHKRRGGRWANWRRRVL